MYHIIISVCCTVRWNHICMRGIRTSSPREETSSDIGIYFLKVYCFIGSNFNLKFIGFFFMRGSRKFCQRESNFDNFFSICGRIEDLITTIISGSSPARQRNAVPMMMAQQPYIFVIFPGGGPDLCPPSLDPRMFVICIYAIIIFILTLISIAYLFMRH